MNCCLWIILLLACRGNCGCGCQNTWRRCGDCDNRMNDCDCGRMYDRRNDRDYDDDCDMGCDRNDRMMDYRDNDCGCMRNESYGRMSEDACGCDENRMTYETFGCQENGVPCPPPVPGNYMR